MSSLPESVQPIGIQGSEVDVDAIIVELREDAAERELAMQTALYFSVTIAVVVAIILTWFTSKAIVRRVSSSWKAVLIAALICGGLYFAVMTMALIFFGNAQMADIPRRFAEARSEAWVILGAMVLASALTAWGRIGLLSRKARKLQQGEAGMFE